MDQQTRQALHDLERVLMDAISDSADAALALHQLQSRGYSLYLAVDCGDPEAPEIAAGITEVGRGGGADPVGARPLSLPPAPPASRPSFRIDGRDLTFLRSIGIDPTRRTRRRAR